MPRNLLNPDPSKASLMEVNNIMIKERYINIFLKVTLNSITQYLFKIKITSKRISITLINLLKIERKESPLDGKKLQFNYKSNIT